MVLQKTIWLINQYASTPETGMGGRHYYLAEELAKKGYKVYVIAAAYTHLLRHPPIMSKDVEIEKINDNFNFVWIKLPHYSEAHSKQRVFNWFNFAWKIKKLKNLSLYKPDLILYSSPSPFGYMGAKSLANSYNCPFVFEVRDIWPLTLLELGGYSRKHPFIKFMQYIEDTAYKNSDFVVSNLANAVEHMQNRGMETSKFRWIPNGFSLSEVISKDPLDEDVVVKIPKNKFIIGYTGTIGVANALDDLINAANLAKEYKDIHFILVGNGKEKEELVAKVVELGLDNITFIDGIPKKQIQSILALFDTCYIGWHNNPLYQFGIAPNKLPEYLYSGKPIIHAFSGYGDPVKISKSGVTVHAENPDAIFAGILELYHMTEDQRKILGENGKKFAIEKFDYSQLANEILSFLAK